MSLALIPLIILLLLRFIFLDARPIHHDEAVNGWFVDGLFSRGFYIYDPQNYHGPLFFYFLAASEKIFGRNPIALRIPAVIFGVLTSLTPLLFRKWIGRSAALVAVLFLTLSPAFVFYSRYSIHETAFVFFCVLFFWQWLVVRKEGFNPSRIIAFGLTLGTMACLKENFVLFGAALACSELLLSYLQKKSTFPLQRRFFSSLVLGFGVAMILVVLFFTGFFQDLDGVSKFFQAFLKWFQTGSSGNGHEKPFTYWLSIMAQFEWPMLLGLGGGVIFWFRSFKSEVRLMAGVGFFLWLLYSVVAYKTPWCLLSFQWFLVLVSSVVIAHFLEKKRLRILMTLFLFAGSGYLAYRAYDVAYQNPDQDEHPYIYGQTYRDLLPPVQKILEEEKKDPAAFRFKKIAVVSGFTWPLPYLLGSLKNVAYYSESNVPSVIDVDILMIDENLIPKYESRILGIGTYSKEVVRARQWASRLVFFTRRPH